MIILRNAIHARDSKCHGSKPALGSYAEKIVPQKQRISKMSVRTVSTISRLLSTYLHAEQTAGHRPRD